MKKQSARALTVHYTIIQLLYFFGFAAIFTYAAVFLRDRGFNSQQIGLTLALSNLATLFVQPAVASWIDRSVRFQLHQIAAILATALLLAEIILIFLPRIFLAVLIAFVLVQMLFFVLQTLLVALSLKMINRGVAVNFGLARGLGSGAYAIGSLVTGLAIEHLGVIVSPIAAGLTSAVMMALILTFYLRPSSNEPAHENPDQSTDPLPATHEAGLAALTAEPVGQFFRRYPQLPLLMLGFVFIFTNHSIYASYTINIVEHLGGSSQTLGEAAAIAGMLEIPVMAYFYLFVRKIPARSLLILSTIFFALKALATWLAPSIPYLLLSQVLQMGAFALYVPASVFYINSILADRDLVRGQAYVAMATTLGGITGNVLGGILYDLTDVPTALLVAFGASVLGILFVGLGVCRRACRPD